MLKLNAVTTTDIVSESLNLAEMIVQSQQFKQYEAAKTALRSDIEAQEMIWNFNKRKDEYEEVQRFGKYHPDYSRVSKEVRELKRKIDLCEPVALFKKSEKDLETLLNDVSLIIAHAVSKTIKVPTGNPFFDSMSCSGGCGTGGKCGCK
ncbi:YlbF family regulator [Anaerobacillus alkaliphilus]|uniref:YlbF family regulator n=1 Tax=Anaerobacillus alkaliphilus TaxID=1548597 RepID=A0A4Q0VQE0_9BACI|nr:YlbF family regulator [Anaerobacillus alkaliphilus]RXI98127.1 YlbF family regulator [Anaerobacillus alkaliphilus]